MQHCNISATISTFGYKLMTLARYKAYTALQQCLSQ